MPSRIIKETICTSEQINNLTLFAEITFYRLMVVVDDFGRMDGRLPILKSRLYPLKDVRVSQLEDALRELSSEELVECYKVDGRPFVRLTGWERHQQKRAIKSKYPGPSNNQPQQKTDDCEHLISNDIKCNQLKSNSLVFENRESRTVVETETRMREDHSGGGFLSEEEMDDLAAGIHEVLDAAKRAGFPDTQADWDKCNELVADYGAAAVLTAIGTCADYPMERRHWRYLRGILEKDKTGGQAKKRNDGLTDMQRKRKAFEERRTALRLAGRADDAANLTMSDMEAIS